MLLQRLLQSYNLYTQDDLTNFVRNVNMNSFILNLISKYNHTIKTIPPVIFDKDGDYIAYYHPINKNIHVNASFLTKEGFENLNIKNYTALKALMFLVFMIGHETYHHYYTNLTPKQHEIFKKQHTYYNALEDNFINNMLLYSVDEELRMFFIEFLYAYYVFNNKEILTNDLRKKIIMTCNPLVHDIIYRDYEDVEQAFDEIHQIVFNKNTTTYLNLTQYNRRFELHKFIVDKLENEISEGEQENGGESSNSESSSNSVLDELLNKASSQNEFSEEGKAFGEALGKEFNTNSNKKGVPILENDGIIEIPVRKLSIPKDKVILHDYSGFAKQLERIMFGISVDKDNVASRSGGSFTSGTFRGDFYRTLNIRNSPADKMVNKFRPLFVQVNDNSASVDHTLSRQIQADTFGLTREIHTVFGVKHVVQYFYSRISDNTVIWEVPHQYEGYFYDYKIESDTPSSIVMRYLYEKYKKEKRDIIFIHRTDGAPNVEYNAQQKMGEIIEKIIKHRNMYFLNISLNNRAFEANNQIHKETNYLVNPRDNLTKQLIDIIKKIKGKI